MAIHKLDPSQLTNFSNGLITEGAVASSQMPLSVVSESLNLDFDKIGSVSTRKGTTLLGNQISASSDILGLYELKPQLLRLSLPAKCDD